MHPLTPPARGPTRPDREDDVDTGSKGGSGGRRRIRCPRCGWEPGREDLWSCVCGHAWNTFDTAGLCPGCGRQWTDTQCLRCHEWSPHREWYVEEPDGSAS